MPRRLAVPLILATMVLAACNRGGTPAAGSPAARAASAPAAATLLLAPEDLRTVTYGTRSTGPVITGSIQPERRADLRAEVSSVVLQVLKENGESVRRGDLLVRLDDTAIRDSLASAEESVRAVGRAFDQAERQVQRLKTLQAQGMTSMQALEDAEVRRNNAQSDLAAAKARVVSARQMLQRTEVRAPFDGVVSERKVSSGDTAQVGKELVKVIDPRSMRFEGLVSADRMHELKTGQRTTFRVNGYPHTEFSGTVRRIDAAANTTTRQVEVMVAFANGELPRVAGLYAEGRIEAGADRVLTVPEGAVARAGEATHVWRVSPARPPEGAHSLSEGQARSAKGAPVNGAVLQKVAVQLGERDARQGVYPVRSGLREGDRILRAPGTMLVDGQQVEFATPASGGAAVPLAAKP